jgi:anti-anti-sigma factor
MRGTLGTAPAPAHKSFGGGFLSLEATFDRPGTLEIRVHGELDMEHASQFQAVLVEAIDGDAAEIVVDLSPLTFMDSTGLEALLFAARVSAADSDRLTVTRPCTQVDRLFEITGVKQSLRIRD